MFFLAAYNGHTAIVEALLKRLRKGIEVNLKTTDKDVNL